MANRLNIYACSGIGAVQETYKYWTDNTNDLTNTQAVNSLFADINYKYVCATRLVSLSNEERISLFNEIDVCVVSMLAAREFSGDTEQLRYAGQIIGAMVAAGKFEYNTLDSVARDKHLDELIGEFQSAYAAHVTVSDSSEAFKSWWVENIESLDKVGLSAAQQQRIMASTKSGVGATQYNNAQLNEWLNNAARYFLYTFYTDAQLAQMDDIFKKRKICQKKVYNYAKALYAGINGGKAGKMDEIIRTGIMAETGMTPEECAASTYVYGVKDKTKGVGGGGAVAVITALAGLVTALATLIGKIVDAVAASQSSSTQLEPTQTEQLTGAPNKDDYGQMPSESKTDKFLPYLAIGGGGILLLYILLND